MALFLEWWSGDAGKTFKPRRGHKPGTRQFALHQHAERTLGSGNLRAAVALPEGEDVQEWLAVKTPASEYVALLMAWVQQQIDDPAVFPTAPGAPFPEMFQNQIVSNIFRRLFRVYAHVFHCHHERVIELAFEAHLNSCFKHFLYFILEFDLVRPEELQPLKPLIDKLIKEDDLKWGAEVPINGRG